jgi:hypothetical protein
MGISTSNPELFKAILAMDAYNRGYNGALKDPGSLFGLVGTALGLATIGPDSSNPAMLPTGADSAVGFYASSYTLATGEKVVSYRGTDARALVVTNGYGVAIGLPPCLQSRCRMRRLHAHRRLGD